MSSLSIAIATRSARARCSAEAKAVRSASATTKRSETRPPATAPSGRALSPRPETRRRAPSRWPTTTRSIPACSSTPATTGPRGAAARASLLGAEILAVTSSVQTLADRRPCRLDRFAEARCVLAAGRGALRPAATASIDDDRYLFHELARVDRGHQVGGDGNDQLGPASSYATPDDYPRPDH